MAYEYEEEVKSVIATETVFSHEETKKETRVKELQEVYQKAKAFDKVLELHSQHIDTESFYGGEMLACFPIENRYEYYDDGLFAYEMYTLIKNYLEDKQND